MKKHTILFRISICLLIFSQLFAEDNPETTLGKHSAIVEADGYVYLAEDKTISQLRREALTNAKRTALEKGQTYISSSTQVENFQLTYDLVLSKAEGFVKIIDSKDIGITSDNRYHYWIRAEIQYRPKKPAITMKETVFRKAATPLTVSIWTDKNLYNEGEKIKIIMKGNKNFYARILYIDASKNVVQLIPNQHRTNNYFEGGKFISIPDTFDRFELEVAPPFGEEKIIVYASSEPQGEIETFEYGETLYRVKSDIQTVGNKTRGVIIKETFGAANGAEFFEMGWEIKTRSID